MPKTQIMKWGNSLAVRIPKPVAEEAGVVEGDPVVIENNGGTIQLRRSEPRVPTLRELISQITRENRYEAIEAGAEHGKERTEW
jgi:antitoxin MazE